ncbi:MAG: hypothetical protein AAGA77_21150 [Bacteroidota bacterium]
MSRTKTVLIIVAGILLLISLIALLMEFREVSAHNWVQNYSFQNEEPKGLHIFKELVDRFYDEVPLNVNSEITDSAGSSNLFVQFVPNYMSDSLVNQLYNLAETGNDVLILTDRFNAYFTDTLPHSFDREYRIDSSLTFNFTEDHLAADTSFTFTFQNKEFDKTLTQPIRLLKVVDWELDLPYIRAMTTDSSALMVSYDVGDGRLFYHLHKDLFLNHAYHQNQMFDYTQRVLAHFNPEQIYLLNPASVYSVGNFENKNPLEFIMSQPALKAAYFLLIFGVLLYVFFGGKRKQKIIPVLERNENTSLEYIETVSQLFYQQDQHEKLVAHMRTIFYHKMLKKFYLSPDHPDYMQLLSKKSKISISELRYVLQRFQELDKSYRFTADQLESLNQRLESIYKQIEVK